jgi:hypothetical protein
MTFQGQLSTSDGELSAREFGLKCRFAGTPDPA